MDMGKVHGRLKMDLSMFAPWMVKERIDIYLYKDRQSYIGGEFEPPTWSNGVAFSPRKQIITYEQDGDGKLRDIIAHEMTHVLFENYWAEEKKRPPTWLNEGLAMLEEGEEPAAPEKSEWYQAMAYLRDGKHIPFERMVKIRPTRDYSHADREDVSVFYVQAYSMVYFLFRRHTRLQFLSFVRSLRDGKPLDKALWRTYRFANLGRFESEWRRWLKLPSVSSRFEAARPDEPSARVEPVKGAGKGKTGDKGKKGLKPVGFREFSYDSWIPRKKKSR